MACAIHCKPLRALLLSDGCAMELNTEPIYDVSLVENAGEFGMPLTSVFCTSKLNTKYSIHQQLMYTV